MQGAYFQARKTLAMFIFVCIILTFFLTSGIIESHHHQHCSGDDCNVCALIHTAKELLRQAGLITFAVVLFFALLRQYFRSDICIFTHITRPTPVKFKVRMNN